MSVLSTTSAGGRQSLVAVKFLVVMTLLLGVAYPAAVWVVAHVVAPGRSDGQLLELDGDQVGSALIGQSFGVEDYAWFHSRPSANDYDGLASSPSNLGPSNPDLIAAIDDNKAAIAKVEGVPQSQVPADAVTASASGLDAFISPDYAEIQVSRVAEARGLSPSAVERLVEAHTSGRTAGFLGQPRVNVLELNLALEKQ